MEYIYSFDVSIVYHDKESRHAATITGTSFLLSSHHNLFVWPIFNLANAQRNKHAIIS